MRCTVVAQAPRLLGVRPRQYDGAFQPGFAGHRLPDVVRHTVLIDVIVLGDELAGIDDDFDPAAIVVKVQIEDQHASLRRDAHTHVVTDGEPGRSLDRLLVQDQDCPLA